MSRHPKGCVCMYVHMCVYMYNLCIHVYLFASMCISRIRALLAEKDLNKRVQFAKRALFVKKNLFPDA